jgi:acetyltransferase-like isoleucine patch superfamily enzyme
MSFLSDKELSDLSFESIGENVKISHKASIYGAEKISLGNNVRIDDFCILSAGQDGILIGSFIHIAAYSSIIGKARIELKDFSGLSARVSVYSRFYRRETRSRNIGKACDCRRRIGHFAGSNS